MKSMSFLEFIRGYNFQDDYNKVYELGNLIESTDSGTLYYNNSKSEKCVWYYSSFDENSELDILGCIRYDELQTTNKDWLIVLIICGTILLLGIVDGIYLKNINKKLKESAEEAKQANKAKSYFLSAMSHDIRTPLNAILGMTYIAKNNLDNPDYAKECLDKSSAASQQLLTLINDILDISKIESGKLFLTYQTTSISSVFDTLTEITKPLALNKKITFTHNLHNIDYNYVSTDKSRLEQICLNLLSNAVKYTNEHGKINLDISEKKLNDEEVLLIIIVEDNGIGMSEEFQKTMYQSFTREINTQVNKTQGTGLGLYIIKLIVDAMGGKISCNSKVNIGTKFKIELNLKIVETPENIDTDKEIEILKEELNGVVEVSLLENWAKGGEGAIDLAQKLTKICETKNEFKYIYDTNDTVEAKIKAVAQKIYGATDVEYSDTAKEQLKELNDSKFPVCIAKTQYSFSDDPKDLLGDKQFNLHVTELKLKEGAEFIVVLTGKIMTMPGLPKKPAAENINIDENGVIEGIF